MSQCWVFFFQFSVITWILLSSLQPRRTLWNINLLMSIFNGKTNACIIISMLIPRYYHACILAYFALHNSLYCTSAVWAHWENILDAIMCTMPTRVVSQSPRCAAGMLTSTLKHNTYWMTRHYFTNKHQGMNLYYIITMVTSLFSLYIMMNTVT